MSVQEHIENILNAEGQAALDAMSPSKSPSGSLWIFMMRLLITLSQHLHVQVMLVEELLKPEPLPHPAWYADSQPTRWLWQTCSCVKVSPGCKFDRDYEGAEEHIFYVCEPFDGTNEFVDYVCNMEQVS